MKAVMAGYPRFSRRGVVCLFAAGALAVAGCSSSSDNGPAPTYKIGGTVSGLAGSGLTLRSSLGDVLPVSANGSFTFPTAAASGTAYAVTVSQHPTSPWQTCSVANGAGTIGNAHVTTVAVTCATNTYAIGGTVTGLVDGGTLVLQNNAGDDLTLTANGPFAFATEGPSGAAYAVTVQSKPASQTCQVARGTGTIAGAAVTDVAVTCGTDTFAVGGTVSGLAAGETLVLQNNGADDKTIAANGTYAFTTPILSGAPYAVTVLTQPATQTCTVSNGSGTVGAAPVTNADVDCAANQYAIGGSVVGLAGTGLVLHSDVGTGEDLTVAANATTFAFTQKAPTGTVVTVTVTTQPSSPAETCTVAGSPVTVGTADVTSLAVSCTTAIQRWEAPTTWGGLWPESATMVQHAYFDGAGIVETKGVAWSVVNGTLPAPRELAAFPGSSRWGAGPFDGPRYQASGGDSGFDFPADMLVCAVVKPDYNPVLDGREHILIAKGVQDRAGWVLMQRHHMFNFYYMHHDGTAAAAGYTPTYFADEGLPDNGPLNPSYVVVCGGRDGDRIVASANSAVDAALVHTDLAPGTQLYAGPTPHRLTIGGYDDVNTPRTFLGRVYETAIWNEPATPANIQAKFDAILGLPAGARYTRNREGPFTGPDGQYHTAWRHAPRAYLPDVAKGFGGGFLFGLQGRNRLTAPYTPPPSDQLTQANPVIAYGEALDLWTPAGGAAVQKDQIPPPGDSERNGAERVALPPGASLSRTLGLFDGAGPIHGMMWIRPVSTTGTLRVSTTQPASGVSQYDVDVSTLTAGQWKRVWLTGLTNDGSQTTPASVSLTNVGADALEFYAWGIDLTQIGRGGDLGAFDPGIEMYDWTGTANQEATPVDVLQLPQVPASTASTGFCLSVQAQPPSGLSWTAPFVADRSPLTWVSDANPNDVVNIFVSGTANPSVQHQRVCAFVFPAPSICFAPTWDAGSQHTLTVCAAPTGEVTLYADGVQVGTPTTGPAPFDLATGHLLIGSNRPPGFGGSLAGWQGFVTRALACPAGSVDACR